MISTKSKVTYATYIDQKYMWLLKVHNRLKRIPMATEGT